MKSKLKALLNSLGITPHRLSIMLRVKPQVVYNWVDDKAWPERSNAEALCKALNCTLDDLYEV